MKFIPKKFPNDEDGQVLKMLYRTNGCLAEVRSCLYNRHPKD
ncbi:hypothetical protein SRABI80_02585 [Peribacillus frigoritolerans]|nr:hypothetical protein SRABI80_02585 [Peribacillus frigoritolerans]